MTLTEFSSSLTLPSPPQNIGIFLEALWYDANGKWDKAHELVQDEENREGAWIHAYLHRKEGDISNAGYWYRRANKQMPDVTLQEEWINIVRSFL